MKISKIYGIKFDECISKETSGYICKVSNRYTKKESKYRDSSNSFIPIFPIIILISLQEYKFVFKWMISALNRLYRSEIYQKNSKILE
jgi:hypothetical protein